MARKERITEPGIYHIINRGVERRNIFSEQKIAKNSVRHHYGNKS
jgi:hypothetical protein